MSPSARKLTDLLNGPTITAITRALIIVGGVLTPVLLWAGQRWINERVAEVPAVIQAHEAVRAEVVRGDALQKTLGDVTNAARDLTREVAALKVSDKTISEELRTAQAATSDVARQVLILQTQLTTQRGEDLRRLDEMAKKIEKIGDKLGVP